MSYYSDAPPGVYTPSIRPVSDARRDLVAGAKVVAVLAVIGAVLGVAWILWSPDRPQGFLPDHGSQWLPGEDEAAVATDGRFLVLALATGIAAGAAVWSWRRLRGPIAVVALAVGSLAAAQLTRLVGYLFGGGSTSGPRCAFYIPDPVNGRCITHIKLSVHTPALYFVQAGVAVLVYSLCASFAVRDDLGRRDPLRLLALRRRAERSQQSVGQGAETQDARRDGDRAGGAQ